MSEKESATAELKKERDILDDFIHGENQCFNHKDVLRLGEIEAELEKRESATEAMQILQAEYFEQCGEMLPYSEMRDLYRDGFRAIVEYDEGTSPFWNFIDLEKKVLVKTDEPASLFNS
jgi:hypothetical protein